jgi:hypothetical protein
MVFPFDLNIDSLGLLCQGDVAEPQPKQTFHHEGREEHEVKE